MIATNIVELRALYQLPDLGALQVLQVVVVGGGEIGAQAAVVSRDDDAAPAGGLLGVDAVLDAQADLPHGVLEDRRVLVVAHAPQVHHAVGRQDVLRPARRVLRRPARDQLRVVLVQQLLVQGDVLRLREDRVVRLQAVLLEQLLVADGLDVCVGCFMLVSVCVLCGLAC